MKTNKAICILILLIVFPLSYLFAGNHTWNGTVSTAWNNGANWSTGQVPVYNDTVTINTKTNCPVLNDTVTLKKFRIYGCTLDLNGKTLTINNYSEFSGGTITNGTIVIRGVSTYFYSTTFNCRIDAISSQVQLNGGKYNYPVYIEQNGTSTGAGTGGNVFNDSVTIKSTGTQVIRLATATADTFNTTATFICSGGAIQIGYNYSTVFNGDVYFSNNSSSGINTNMNGTGTTKLASGKHIYIGSLGFNPGTLLLTNFYQYGTSAPDSLVLGSTATLNIIGSTFESAMDFSAGSVLSKTSIYANATFRKSANTGNSWYGGNTFNGTASFYCNSTNAAGYSLATQKGNTFNGNANFYTTTGVIQVSNADSTFMKGDCYINNTQTSWYSTGKVIFTGTNAQVFSGTVAYSLGHVILDKASNGITFNQNVTVDSTFKFTKGILTLGSSDTLTFKATSSISGSSASSFVNGPVKKIGNSAFTVPIGKGGYYKPLSISAPSNSTDAFAAEYFHNQQSNGTSLDSNLMLLSTIEYWKLSRLVGSSNVKPKIQIDSTNSNNVSLDQYHVTNWNGSKWLDLGNASYTGNSTLGTITANINPTSYSYFSSALTRIGNNCSNYISIPFDTTINYTTIVATDTITWFSFISDSSKAIVRVSRSGLSDWTQLNNIFVYSNNCSSLTPIDSVSIIQYDTLANLFLSGLTPGNRYYIALMNDLTSGSYRQAANGNYKISITAIPRYPTCNSSSNYCNIINNGDFRLAASDALLNDDPFTNNKVCFMTSQEGSPQIKSVSPYNSESISNDTTYAYLWAYGEKSEIVKVPGSFTHGINYGLTFWYRETQGTVSYPAQHSDTINHFYVDLSNGSRVVDIVNISGNTWRKCITHFNPSSDCTYLLFKIKQNTNKFVSIDFDNIVAWSIIPSVSNVSICEGDSIIISEANNRCPSNGENYSWKPSSDFRNANLNEPTFIRSTSGTHQDTLSISLLGTIDTLTVNGYFNSTVLPKPSFTISQSTPSLCNEPLDTLKAIVINTTPPYSYLWSNSHTTSSINVFDPETYSVTVTDNNGCKNNLSANVIKSLGALIIPSLSGICTGPPPPDLIDPEPVELSVSVPYGYPPFKYTWSNDEEEESIFISDTNEYSVVVEDPNGCTGYSSIKLPSIPYPYPPILSGTTTTCSGSGIYTVQNVVPGATYSWVVKWGTNTTNLTGTSNTITFNSFYNYNIYVTVTLPNGCSNAVQLRVYRCCVSPTSYIDHTFSGGGFNTQTISMAGLITISGLFIINNSHITMDIYSQIKLLPGATLMIQNSTIGSCDRKFWQGIDVNNSMVIMDNSTIEGASIALNIYNNGGYDLISTNGINTFINNNIALNIIGSSFQNRTIYGTTITSDVYFQNYEQYLQQTPQPCDRPYAGIQIYDGQSMQFGWPALHTSNERLTIEHCNIGVLSKFTSLTFYGTWFDDINHSSCLPADQSNAIDTRSSKVVGLTMFDGGYSQFNDCYRGIFGYRSGILVDNVDFLGVTEGIKVISVPDNTKLVKFVVRNNCQFTFRRFGININDLVNNTHTEIDRSFFEDIDPSYSAILSGAIFIMEHNRNTVVWQITNNDIKLNYARYGIYINGSGPTGLQNNTIHLLKTSTQQQDGITLDHCSDFHLYSGPVNEYGAFANNIIDGQGLLANKIGINVISPSLRYNKFNEMECNEMDDIMTEMNISNNSSTISLLRNEFHSNSNSSDVGLMINTTQLFNQIDRGNQWIGNFTTLGADGVNSGAAFNRFYTPLTGSTLPTFNAGVYRFTNQNGTPPACGVNTLVGVITDEDISVATDSTWDESQENQKWQAQRFLMNKLMYNKNHIGDSTAIINFWNDSSKLEIKKLAELQFNLDSLISLNNEPFITPLKQLDSLYRLQDSLIFINNVLLSADKENYEDSLLLIDNNEERWDSLVDAGNQIDSICELIKSGRFYILDSLWNINEDIEVSTVQGSTEKAINTIYLEKIAKEDSLASEELENVISYAELCIDDYGHSVAIAREIAYQFTDSLYGQFSCEEVEEEMRMGSNLTTGFSNNNQVNIYPVPVSSQCIIELLNSDLNCDKFVVTLISSDGKSVKLDFISDGKNIYCDLSTYSNGVYVIEIKESTNNFIARKLVSIIH